MDTRIVVCGNTRDAPYAGVVEYVATSTGSHIFYTTNSKTERMRINSDGLITTSGNISCGGGIHLTGADAFYNPNAVTPANRTNTFLSFRGTGGNDWAYLRNIGGDETLN